MELRQTGRREELGLDDRADRDTENNERYQTGNYTVFNLHLMKPS
jgi:hypothetical protein